MTCDPGGSAHPEDGRPTADEREFVTLYDRYLTQYAPLHLESSRAWWEANVTGSDAAFQRKQAVEHAIVELHSDRTVFERLKRLKGRALVESTLRRQHDVLYHTFLSGQADPEVQKRTVALENQVEQTFNTHRSQVNGQALTENTVREVLSESTDSALVEAAWKGYMAVGAKVADALREIVALRNQVARELGYRNFYVMELDLQEIDEAELLRLFDELDDLTREPFAALKHDLDGEMAARFGIARSALRPWHFGDLFFQEAAGGQESSLDRVFQGQDLLGLAARYYASLGMPVEAVLARSDLYEKPGKSPHAFAVDIDREGDVRILCNLKSNTRWMDTLLHELGHAVYDAHIDRRLPFILREASSALTTEGIAMMMGSMAKNEEFLTKALQVPPADAATLVASAERSLNAEKVIFSRWAQVVVRFERAMYDNPDQDLCRLWWELKQRYQLLNPPEQVDAPDYAAKVHIAVYPAYYHSYVMGDLFASQLRQVLAVRVVGEADPRQTCFHGRPAVGEYLRVHVFEPGNLYPWDELTRRATGEPLTAKYFAEQYVQ